MKKTRLVSLLSALIVCSSAVSCGSSDVKNDETTNADSVSQDTTKDEYSYPDENFNGYEFTFFSPDEQFGCNVRVDFEEQTGKSSMT